MRKSGNAGKVLRDFWWRANKYPLYFWGAIGLGTVVHLTTIGAPLYLKRFLDLIAKGTPTDPAVIAGLYSAVFFFALLTFAGWALRRVEHAAMYMLEARVMSDLDNASFAHLIRHSHHFFISNFAGSLVRRVGRYRRAYEVVADAVLFQLYPAVLLSIGIIVILSLRHLWLGVTLGAWTVLFVSVQYVLIRLLHPLRLAHAKEDSATTGVLADAVGNQMTIALFSGFSHEEKYFAQAVEKLRQAAIRSWAWDDLIWTVQGFLAASINVGMLWGALILWREGHLTVGDFALIQAYLLTLFDRLVNIGRELRHVFSALADASEMRDILDTPHEVCDRAHAKPLSISKGEIVFRAVDFRFGNTSLVLSKFNLHIRGGEKVALVGPSGGGKSTITKLLLRLYDVSDGAVEIDGQNIADVTLDSLHDAIAFVPQEPILFHRTLLENIRYGRRDATDDEVIRAAKQAHCHEFIERLPHGYETYVGERGIKLSGGERQRIAIARAILKNAPILVLDEATSSLDSESERFIQEALSSFMEGKTVFVIAHRLSTIMQMDRIVVIEAGRVVAEGTHRELIARGGLYRTLWDIQAGGFLGDGAVSR